MSIARVREPQSVAELFGANARRRSLCRSAIGQTGCRAHLTTRRSGVTVGKHLVAERDPGDGSGDIVRSRAQLVTVFPHTLLQYRSQSCVLEHRHAHWLTTALAPELTSSNNAGSFSCYGFPCYGESRSDEAAQYRPVTREVGVTTL
jgi:hypothetical protein